MTMTAVLGGGAIGMLLAGKLAATGCPAELWTRTGQQAQLIKEQGIQIDELLGDSTSIVRIRAVSFDEVPAGFSGLLLVTLKQTAITNELLHELDQKLAQEAGVVLFQNGIGHAERFADALPGRRIAVAVTTEAALRTGKASVRHTGSGETWIGQWPGAETEWTGDPDRTGRMESKAASLEENLPQQAVQLLKKAGFSARLSNCIRNRMFRKLVINAVVNPLTALWKIRNGELPASPERLAVMEALFEETFGILHKHGFKADRQELWEEVLRVCELTANNRSSMLQDVLAGRATEIDALNGAVCRMADQAGISAPWNSTVTALVKAV